MKTEEKGEDKVSKDNSSNFSKQEIIAIFEKYDFRDSHEHPLTLCQDFHTLLDSLNLAQESKFLNL